MSVNIIMKFLWCISLQLLTAPIEDIIFSCERYLLTLFLSAIYSCTQLSVITCLTLICFYLTWSALR